MDRKEWYEKAKALQRVQWLLSKGHQPESFGKRLGAGVQKAAYLCNGWVVKKNTGGFRHGESHKMPKALLKLGLKPCKTYLGTKDWVIQEPCRVWGHVDPKLQTAELRDRFRAIRQANIDGKAGERYDIHEFNVGLDEHDNFVCFDW